MKDPRAHKYVSAKPAAEAIGVHPVTLWRYYRKGLVTPAWVTIGGQTRWDIEDLRRQHNAMQEAASKKRPRVRVPLTGVQECVPELDKGGEPPK